MRVQSLFSKIVSNSKEDLKQKSFMIDCLCEFLSTSILITMVVFILVSTDDKKYKLNTTHLGIFLGGFCFMMLEAYGPFACLMNPMVAFSLCLAEKITFGRAIVYILLEVTGAIVGTWLGLVMTPHTSRIFPAMYPATGLNYMQAIGVEAFFSFNLIFVFLSCRSPEVTRVQSHLPNLAIAMALCVGHWAGGTHTGGFMNPIIPLAPAQLSGDFRYYWIYWFGPFIGGPLAVPVYKLFIKYKDFDSM